MRDIAHPQAHILAKVRFLPTAEGGRSKPTPTDRLGLLFKFGGDLYESFLLLYEIGSISPGDEAVVPIWFMFSESILLAKLRKGSRFRLREGARDVAEGEVIEILEDQAERHIS